MLAIRMPSITLALTGPAHAGPNFWWIGMDISTVAGFTLEGTAGLFRINQEEWTWSVKTKLAPNWTGPPKTIVIGPCTANAARTAYPSELYCFFWTFRRTSPTEISSAASPSSAASRAGTRILQPTYRGSFNWTSPSMLSPNTEVVTTTRFAPH